MTRWKTYVALSATLGCTALAVLGAGAAIRAADHGNSPQVRNDTRTDINDVYVFASPETPANTVLIMTVCPLAGATGPRRFAPKVKYEFALDTNGDEDEDQVYSVVFAEPDATGNQKYTLSGPNKLKSKSVTETVATLSNGGKAVCGYFDDPFFFDLIGFKRELSFSPTTSRNFFDGLNTMAIVVEVPTTSFGTLTNSSLAVWARTKKGKKQIDRMGRPAINTVLIAPADKDAFNSSEPKDDVALWRTKVVANIMVGLGRTEPDANGLADALLPDVLTYDPTNAAGFLNGRKLADDVIDAELALLSGDPQLTDFVASDSTFRATFPYLGLPNP